MGVAQIELPLNPAPRLVLELTAAIEIIDQVSLGSDQEILDLVATLHEPFMAVVAVASVLDMFEALVLTRAQGPENIFRELALRRQLVEPFEGCLDCLPPSLEFLGSVGVSLSTPGAGETKPANY
jgi:hypothetical protein